MSQIRNGQVPSFGTPAAEASAPAVPAALPEEAGRVVAEGRLVTYPGAEVVVGTELAGTVVRLLVEEKDRVRKGQLLAELRADDLRAELAEARARVDEADADIRLADVEVGRAERLLAEQVGTQEAADRARRNRESRLRAAVDRARGGEPAGGGDRQDAHRRADRRRGDPALGAARASTSRRGDALLTVADLDRTRVEAEVDEFDAGRVALGAPVRVTAEGYTDQSWQAAVEEIPDAVIGPPPQAPGPRPAVGHARAAGQDRARRENAASSWASGSRWRFLRRGEGRGRDESRPYTCSEAGPADV